MSSLLSFFFSWNATILFSVILIGLIVWEFLDKKTVKQVIDKTEKKDPFGLLNK